MLNGNIADFARCVRTFYAHAKALSGKQGKYTGGTNIVTACRYYSCRAPGSDGCGTQRKEWLPATGMFTVRIWGKLCHKSRSNVQRCWDLNNPAPPAGSISIARFAGYSATFGPGTNCGPARTIVGLEGLAPYAAWCDFTVNIRRR